MRKTKEFLVSAVYFLKESFWNTYIIVSGGLLVVIGVLNYFKPILPKKYWGYLDMWFGWDVFIGIIILVLILSAINAYHKLRIARYNEFCCIYPEIKRNEGYREFRKLYDWGFMLKNAGTEQRQMWDEKILKALSEYCEDYKQTYLINTGRHNDSTSHMDDRHFESALGHIKYIIDNIL